MNTKVDLLMVGLFLSDSKVGIYSLASLFAEGFLEFVIVIQNSLNPKISHLISKKDFNYLVIFLKKIKKSSYIIITTLGFLSIFMYPLFLQIFINKQEFFIS